MPVKKIVKGEIITAKYLNIIGESIDTLERGAKAPKQLNKPTSGDVQNEAATDTEAVETVPPQTFIETNRTISLVQVFDDEDENYAEVERIEIVTFVNGNGEELSLSFNNT